MKRHIIIICDTQKTSIINNQQQIQMELLQLPKLLLGSFIQTLKTKDVISLGDTCKQLREIAQFELNKRKEAYLERFRYPGANWDFRGMWSLPFEIIQELPEEKKPVLYKRVGCPGYPFEQAVKELEAACEKGDGGTGVLGWTALTRNSPLKFIKETWNKYPWCRYGMTNHPEFNWEDVIEHPERYSFSTLSLGHPDAYKMASQYPHLPWDKHYLQNHHPNRSTELTIERMIQLGLQPTYEVYDYPCVSIEDILNHPELNWDCVSSLSYHRELTINILKKYPEGLKPHGWHKRTVTQHIPIQDILTHPDVFPWDSNVIKERLDEEKKRFISIDELLENTNNFNTELLECIIQSYPIQDVLKLWHHPEAKHLIISWYQYYNEYESNKNSLGKDLCRRKDFSFDIIFKYLDDPDIKWDWKRITKNIPLEQIKAHPELPWCVYTLSRREDLTWNFVKENLTTFEWCWENLGYNKNMFNPDL